MPLFNLTKIKQARKPPDHNAGKYGDHKPNPFGSRTPIVENDPHWSGFTPPVWLIINTTDPRKLYR